MGTDRLDLVLTHAVLDYPAAALLSILAESLLTQHVFAKAILPHNVRRGSASSIVNEAVLHAGRQISVELG